MNGRDRDWNEMEWNTPSEITVSDDAIGDAYLRATEHSLEESLALAEQAEDDEFLASLVTAMDEIEDYQSEETKLEKPKGLTDKHLEYLDNLRESGVTNMHGAGAYLERKFGLDRSMASDYLGYWMKTFSERHFNSERD